MLISLDRDATVDTRVLTSLLAAVLNVESTTINEDADALRTVDNDAASLVRVLTSALIPVLIVESTTLNEADDALRAVDKDVTEFPRTLISVLNPVLRTACVDNSDEWDVLRALESDVTAEFRVLISADIEFNKFVLPFVMVVANDGSFPMAVARSDSVFNVEDRPSPAMAVTLSFTKGSVAITLPLYLG